MIAIQILWAILCLALMGWSFWRFGKSVVDADHTIKREKEMAEFHGKIADNRREELAELSNELGPLIQERDRLRAEIDEYERQSSFKAQFERRRLFLLSDRRAREDLEWHVPVSLREGFGMIWHPAVTRSWTLGRRIVIWAKSKEHAKRAVTARLPESSGFIVSDPVEGKEFPPLAPIAALPLEDDEFLAERDAAEMTLDVRASDASGDDVMEGAQSPDAESAETDAREPPSAERPAQGMHAQSEPAKPVK